MASLDLTAASSALKEYYAYDVVAELAYKKNPILGIMPKNEKMGGKKIIVPFEMARPLGRGVTVALSQTAEVPSNFEAFEITWVKNYGSAKIDGDVAEASQNDKNAFMNLLTSQIDGVMKEVARDLAKNLYRSSSGCIGQISSTSTVASDTITLATIQDAANFEVGMILGSATTETGSYSTGSGTGEKLHAINRATGEMTSTSATWATVVTGIAASDYLFVVGDHPNNSTAKKIKGLDSWLPATAPTSGEDFNGVDRSVDSRLYGLYYTGTGESINETLINAQSQAMAMHGAEIDLYLMNPAKVTKLVNVLGSKVEYEGTQAAGAGGPIANIGFKGIVVQGDNGPIKIVSDFNCPYGYAYGLTLDDWKLWSVGQAPHILQVDGNRIRAIADEDAYRVRCGYYAALACKNPGGSVRVLLPA